MIGGQHLHLHLHFVVPNNAQGSGNGEVEYVVETYIMVGFFLACLKGEGAARISGVKFYLSSEVCSVGRHAEF